MPVSRILALSCLIAAAPLARAQDLPTPASGPEAVPPAATTAATPAAACGVRAEGDTRPRIGLVLGGGGARGFAHVSVLKELERQRIPIDCIAGTSMGAIVGGLYASGMDAVELEAQMRAMDWGRMFVDRLDRPQRSFRRKRDDDLALVAGKPGIGNEGLKIAPGVLSGERALLLLEELTEPVATREDFDRLPIPFRAVATDLNSGQPVVLGSGNLALAMRASMSIPGIFKPVPIDGRVLVDGGLANQVPVDVVRAMGADIVIAVDVSTPLYKLDEGASLFAIVDQISGFMTVGSARAQTATLGPDDVLVRPPLGAEVSTSDFEKIELAMSLGERGIEDVRPRLAALSLAPEAYAAALAARDKPSRDAPVVDFVRLDNRSRYADAFLLARLDIAPGQPLDSERLQRNLQRIYGLDTMDLVTYDVIEEDDRTGVVVRVVPHSYGPNYLETGLSLYSDFSGDFFVNLRAGVLRAPVNDTGGEVRGLLQLGDEPGLLMDWYQPLGAESDYFTLLQLSAESPKFTLFNEDGERLANFRAPNWGGELGLGREFGNFGAATLSLRRRLGSAKPELFDPLFEPLDYDLGEAEFTLTYDRIDSTYLPRSGTYAVFSQVASREALGADGDFDQSNFDVIHARAIGKHSGFAGLRYHVSSSDLIPIQSQFRLGGLTRFAGYRPNERLADNYALVYGGYTYELGRVLSRPAVLGGTLEYGRSWATGGDLDGAEGELHGSIYFGFDSWLGPLQLGYGLRQGGDGIFLLELGRPR
ncbi:MAG TPA: patatin-like phospholipase family protein [Arenimonas sp.]|uniref:patatin-like phospholipase family protein n=1 Tax=Arenimonas sp. TaxID=1872635 RepID=UPI002D802A0E|nr:patatin-like phospholipase family protein [Arenimonas sp.]HEU0154037.1 patatin-like phospholipase family protein [Arenimonas sp.]